MKNYLIKVRISTNQPSDVSVEDRQETIAAICAAVGSGNVLGLALPGGSNALTRVISAKVTGDSVSNDDAEFVVE